MLHQKLRDSDTLLWYTGIKHSNNWLKNNKNSSFMWNLTVFFSVFAGVWTADFLEDFGVLNILLDLGVFSGVQGTSSSSSSSSLLEE